jgi:bifunctional non-homologous end joining protein LigD
MVEQPMVGRAATGMPVEPRDWRPMRPYRGRRPADITDPVVEPLWSGARVLVHINAATLGDSPVDEVRRVEVHLIEDLGADVAPELPELAAAIAAAVMAEDAVIDGVISRQVGLSGVGASPITEMRHRPALIRRDRTDLDVVPRGAAAEPEGDIDGLIALDLLRVDGVSLLDVPLLERKRLLESVVQPGSLVRTSPHVRPPIDSWIVTWKSLGLRGGILKAANSRYLPGTETIEWRLVERLGR